uniref:Secreted protein n=1 Tax=Ixodes ricinus TaxID=34613 RepID=A0A6B0UI11_IXORI
MAAARGCRSGNILIFALLLRVGIETFRRKEVCLLSFVTRETTSKIQIFSTLKLLHSSFKVVIEEQAFQAGALRLCDSLVFFSVVSLLSNLRVINIS